MDKLVKHAIRMLEIVEGAGAYLVTVRYKGMFKNNVEIAQWEQPEGQLTFDTDIKGKWKWMGQEDVIAWMPMPESYKET